MTSERSAIADDNLISLLKKDFALRGPCTGLHLKQNLGHNIKTFLTILLFSALTRRLNSQLERWIIYQFGEIHLRFLESMIFVEDFIISFQLLSTC